METVIAFLVLVGFLIWFHELGHFLLAKLFGVRVEVFSVGFGPPILSKRFGETLYQIAVVPLGGFVKLYGEDKSTSDPKAFSSKPNWQKILIALGGPLFNIALTVLLFAFVHKVGVEVPKYLKEPVVIGHVEKDSWGEKAGLMPGDRILKVGDVRVDRWEDLRGAILTNVLKGKRELGILVEREEERLLLKTVLPEIETGRERLGIHPSMEPVIGTVFENIPGVGPSPAYQVGLKPGDRILAVNGKRVESWYEAVKLIRDSGDGYVRLHLLRNDKTIVKELVPAKDPRTGMPVLGIAPKVETVKEMYPIGEALTLALEKTKELTVMTFKVLGGLITGDISLKTLGGPIAIAEFAGQAAQSGVLPFLSSMAFISLQLGIFNLLPLPVLDGGLILLFLIESLRRKPLPDRFKEYWQKVGFALIISLMVFVVINDLIRIIGR